LKTKLEKAAFMLTFSKQNVTQISEELSFLSPAYFINCFKAYYNMTPTQYRKHHSFPSVEKIPSNELEEEIEKEIEE
jgi:AraC-like DNA-binding protein